MIILRLAIYLALIGIVSSLVIGLLLRDRRYFRLAWQIFKFSLVLLLVFAALIFMGRAVLYRMPL